jgi:predicted membrane chloride channel (bestrophin family)
MANTYYDTNGVTPEERQRDLDRVAACTWSFVRCMKRHLSPEDEDEEKFRIELYEKLPKEQAEMIIAAAHRPNRALQDLSYAIDNLPMHFMRKNEIHAAVTIFEDNLGSSERLLRSPIPLFYSRHTVRFLGVWLCLLPFALYKPFAGTWNHVGMVPAAAILAVFLFGIEELATQLEEPFTILPMQAFCDKIYNWCREIVSWAPGDNGRTMKPVKPQHAYFAQVDAPPQRPMAFASSAPPAEAAPTNGANGDVAPNGISAAAAGPGTLSMADFLKQQGQGN